MLTPKNDLCRAIHRVARRFIRINHWSDAEEISYTKLWAQNLEHENGKDGKGNAMRRCSVQVQLANRHILE